MLTKNKTGKIITKGFHEKERVATINNRNVKLFINPDREIFLDNLGFKTTYFF
jgi:hypothetical protein